MSTGRVSDYTVAAVFAGRLPKADWLLADCGNDADLLEDAAENTGP